MIRKSKRKFDELESDSKAIHRLSVSLLNRKLKNPLPYSSSTTSLPIFFQDHFTNKLENINNALPTPTIIPSPIPPPYSICEFSEPYFSQIAKLLSNTISSSSTEPLPLKLLHQVIDTISPSLHKIYSTSLSTGIVTDDFKTAVITPHSRNAALNLLS